MKTYYTHNTANCTEAAQPLTTFDPTRAAANVVKVLPLGDYTINVTDPNTRELETQYRIITSPAIMAELEELETRLADATARAIRAHNRAVDAQAESRKWHDVARQQAQEAEELRKSYNAASARYDELLTAIIEKLDKGTAEQIIARADAIRREREYRAAHAPKVGGITRA